jgi:hypothetical protein
MAPCQTFVSLLRSCYSTRMRFFADDLSIETPVDWYFTDPGAKWCGLSNVFNSRNWYGGQQDWPLLGEVEGAARPWRNGSGLCHGNRGPFGSAEQWEHGAQVADAIPADPCPGPQGQGFGLVKCDFVDMFVDLIATRYGPDIWAVEDYLAPGFWLTLRAVPPAACCFARSGVVSYTSGPPGFVELKPFVQTGFSTNCGFGEWEDPVGTRVVLALTQ